MIAIREERDRVKQYYLLEIRDLSMGFVNRNGIVPVLDRVNVKVKKNEVIAIVGESGCGKSVTALSVMRLLKSPPARYTGGSILLNGEDLLHTDESKLRNIRGNRISMIFQEPLTSLNPVLTIGDQIGEVFSLHEKLTRKEIRKKSIEILRKVKIPSPESRLRSFPGQFSGGMRQRIMIAMAIACNPELLIADEPTTALDVTIQAQILELLLRIRENSDMSIMLITHDLGVVAEFAERIVVMYAGQVIEEANTKELFTNPLHPYTKGLLASLPRMNMKGGKLHTIEGSVPSLSNMPVGCRFNIRCPYSMPQCTEREPNVYSVTEMHYCKCHLMENIDKLPLREQSKAPGDEKPSNTNGKTVQVKSLA